MEQLPQSTDVWSFHPLKAAAKHYGFIAYKHDKCKTYVLDHNLLAKLKVYTANLCQGESPFGFDAHRESYSDNDIVILLKWSAAQNIDAHLAATLKMLDTMNPYNVHNAFIIIFDDHPAVANQNYREVYHQLSIVARQEIFREPIMLQEVIPIGDVDVAFGPLPSILSTATRFCIRLSFYGSREIAIRLTSLQEPEFQLTATHDEKRDNTYVASINTFFQRHPSINFQVRMNNNHKPFNIQWVSRALYASQKVLENMDLVNVDGIRRNFQLQDYQDMTHITHMACSIAFLDGLECWHNEFKLAEVMQKPWRETGQHPLHVGLLCNMPHIVDWAIMNMDVDLNAANNWGVTANTILQRMPDTHPCKIAAKNALVKKAAEMK